MKISELINQLAELSSAIEAHQHKVTIKVPPAEPAYVPHPGDGSELPDQPDDLFMPPLQLKLELLKKGVGVKSMYDENQAEEREFQSNQELGQDSSSMTQNKDLAQMRKNAGLAAVINDEAASDEPFDG